MTERELEKIGKRLIRAVRLSLYPDDENCVDWQKKISFLERQVFNLYGGLGSVFLESRLAKGWANSFLKFKYSSPEELDVRLSVIGR